MHTTITVADDIAAAVEQLRRERSIGTSAVNELVRAFQPPLDPGTAWQRVTR